MACKMTNTRKKIRSWRKICHFCFLVKLIYSCQSEYDKSSGRFKKHAWREIITPKERREKTDFPFYAVILQDTHSSDLLAYTAQHRRMSEEKKKEKKKWRLQIAFRL